jgi:predicted regulator of Ras-like GTPase activity (Roadblock/LC7/MglB family)
MSFSAILRTIVEGCGGGIGAALMGNDGIPIDQFTVATRPSGDGAAESDFEIDTVGAEFGRILEDIRKTFDSLAGGVVEETIVRGARFSLVFRAVDDENFLIVAIEPDGNLGKARYLIRRHLLAIRSEL